VDCIVREYRPSQPVVLPLIRQGQLRLGGHALLDLPNGGHELGPPLLS